MNDRYYQIVIKEVHPAPEKPAMTRWATGDSGITQSLQHNCQSCGRKYYSAGPLPPLIVHHGTKWPDFIRASTVPLGFHVSKRVADALVLAGMSGFTLEPMGSIQAIPGRLNQNPPPVYIVIRFTTRFACNYDGCDNFPNKWCHECCLPFPNTERRPIGLPEPRIIFDWGTDDFRLTPGRWGTPVSCTQRVVDLAQAEKWTGVSFYPEDI